MSKFYWENGTGPKPAPAWMAQVPSVDWFQDFVHLDEQHPVVKYSLYKKDATFVLLLINTMSYSYFTDFAYLLEPRTI